MPARSFSLWDHHTHRIGDRESSLTGELLDRTAGFDQFEKLDDKQRARLEMEYWRRVQYWTDATRPGVRWAGITTIATVTALVFGTGITIVVVTIRDGWPMLLFAAIIIAFAWGARIWVRRQARLYHTITRGLCPDCGYDLAGGDHAIAPSLFGGKSVGPRRCPECGSPWPLLPAAIPGSEFWPG